MRVLTGFAEDLVYFPTPTWWLTTTCSFSSRGSDASPDLCKLLHTHSACAHIHTHILKIVGLSTLSIPYTFVPRAVLMLLLLKEAQVFVTRSSHCWLSPCSVVSPATCTSSLQPMALRQNSCQSSSYCAILPVLQPCQGWGRSWTAVISACLPEQPSDRGS